MRRLLANLWSRWDGFWFRPANTLPLEFLRIGLGAALLISYGTWTPEIDLFFGADGYYGTAAQAARESPWWFQSVLFHFPGRTALHVLHWTLLTSCVGLMLGCATPLAKTLVWIAHLSYLHFNPSPFYGADNIAGNMLFLLLFAPVGRRLSLDALWRRWRGRAPPEPSSRARVILRLIQIQLCIMYFFAGFEKLRGDLWWSGDAVWVALNNVEFMCTSESVRDWLARHYMVINLLTYGTIVLECAYPFLIWKKPWRPWLLGGVVLMHAGVALMMGLWFFSFLMALFNLSFLPLPKAWLREAGEEPDPAREPPAGSA